MPLLTFLTVHDDIERGSFLGLFCSVGTLAAFGVSLRAVFGKNLELSVLGASAAICSIVGAWCAFNKE